VTLLEESLVRSGVAVRHPTTSVDRLAVLAESGRAPVMAVILKYSMFHVVIYEEHMALVNFNYV